MWRVRHSLSKSIFSTMFLGLTLSSWLWMNICPSSFSVQPYLFIQTFTWVSVKRITFSLLYSHNQEWMCDLRSPRGSPSISARSRCSMFWYVIPTTWQMTKDRQTQPFQTYHNSRIHTYAEYYINVKNPFCLLTCLPSKIHQPTSTEDTPKLIPPSIYGGL